MQCLILSICKLISGFEIPEHGMVVSTMILLWELGQVFQSLYIPPEQKDI